MLATLILVCTLAVMPSCRLAAQVDPTGRWRTLETAHFDVHTRAEYRDVALRAAGEAEAAWEAFARLLTPPRSRIDLVVADNSDEANGYASFYPRPRIVIYLIPPAGDLQLAAYDRWLRLVITHELAHVFHLDPARGWWRAARTVLGRAPFLFPNAYTAPWMREGLAVFYESRLTGAGRLDGALHGAVVGARAVESGGMPLDEGSTASPRWPSGYGPYAFGSRFMGEAAARFGDSVVARYVNEVARRPIPYLQLGSAWRRVAGEGITSVWDEAQGAPGAPGAQDAPDAPVELLRGLRSAVPPRVSADGSRILVAFDNGRDAMRLAEIRRDSGSSRRIARLNGANGLAWTADGSALVSQLEFTDPYTMRADLWTIAPDGHQRRLTDGARLREPDVAADGTIVAVRVVPGGTELVLLPDLRDLPDLRVLRVLRALRALRALRDPRVEWATPRFHPTSPLIAAVRVENGWHDIVLLDRSGTIVRQLTRDSIRDLTPAFSPDGRWLAWSREIDGVPQIVGVRLEGDGTVTGAARLTDEPFAAYAPGPANDSLYYLSYHADGFRLVSVPLTGTSWLLPELPGLFAINPPLSDAVVRAEHPYRSLSSALPRYWLPQLYAEPGGMWAGAFSSGSDALERHIWTATLVAGLGSVAGQWSGRLAWRYAGPGHALLDASASHAPQLASGTACCDPDDALNAGVSLVRRRWRSQALLRFGGEYSREVGAERAGASLSGQFSHTITPALSTGTQWGARLGTSLRYRRRVGQTLESTEFYVRLAAFESDSSRRFARRVFGALASLGTIAGSDPVEFSMGGVSGGSVAVLPGIALGGGPRAFPIRGLAPGTLSGRQALGTSFEVREPLALIGRGLGLLPLGLDRLSATLFADAGVVWSSRYCATATPPATGAPQCEAWAASVGPELSSVVVLGYDVPLRFRVGLALAGSTAGGTLSGGPAGYVAVGSSF